MSWQRPYWRHEAAYPLELPVRLWRWELVRRREDYQQDWAAWEATLPMPAVHPYGRPIFFVGPQEIAAKYGMLRLTPPEVDDPGVVESVPFAFGVMNEDEQHALFDAGFQGFYFDLTAPLGPQIAALRFTWGAYIRCGRIKRKRQRKGKTRLPQWTLYLRVLDAVYAGELHADIAKALDPIGDATETNVSDWLQAARELQDWAAQPSSA